MSISPLAGLIPGVLPFAQLVKLCEQGWIQGVGTDDKHLIDASAVDLTLSDEGYEMVQGSVKPFGKSYSHFVLSAKDIAKRLSLGNDGAFKLSAKKTYVFRLKQELGSELRRSKKVYGQATAKSSVGRVDVLARLIVDGMNTYEYFDPQELDKGNGRLFLEVTPITFDVMVKEGVSLSQLRLFYGKPQDCEIKGEELYSSVLLGDSKDGSLSVDISNTKVGKDTGCAFCATPRDGLPAIPLWEDKDHPEQKPDPQQYWAVLQSSELGNKQDNEDPLTHCLQIKKESFYILRSRERITLPPGVAVYCRAIDETIGEMRIHYAGFVHPGFGRNRNDSQSGTQLIFEVRGHDVTVTLTDYEKMARLTFYRMSEDAKSTPSPYENQTLQLSKYFRPWPET